MYEVIYSDDVNKRYKDLHFAMCDMQELLEDNEQAVVIRVDNDEHFDVYIATKFAIPRQFARYNPYRIAFERIKHEQLYDAIMKVKW